MQRFRWKIVRNEISYAKQSECRGLHWCVRVCFNCQRESLRVNSKMETFIEGVGVGAGVRGASREKRFTGIAGNGKEAAASTHRCSTGLTRCTGDRRGGIWFLHYKWAWNTDQDPSFIYRGRRECNRGYDVTLNYAEKRTLNCDGRSRARHIFSSTISFENLMIVSRVVKSSRVKSKWRTCNVDKGVFQTRRPLELCNLKSIEIILTRSLERNVPDFPDRCFSSDNKCNKKVD